MRRIVPKKISLKDQEIRIEHYEPSSKNKELELDYQNFLGVCHGGIKDEREAMQKFATRFAHWRENLELMYCNRKLPWKNC